MFCLIFKKNVKLFLSVTVLAAQISGQDIQNRAPVNIPPSSPQMTSFSNGTFEDGTNSWSFNLITPNLGTFELTDQNPFEGSRCAKINVERTSSELWHVQLIQRNFTIQKNIIYKFSYWARGENGAGILEVCFVKASPPWTFYSAKKEKMTSEWKKYEMIFTAPLTTRDIQVGFQCAHQKGSYYIDNVELSPVGELEVKELPHDWYDNAEQRIDSIRKGDFQVKIIDKQGKPVTGSIDVKLIRHDFSWGTCLSFYNEPVEDNYKKIALKHFNSGVFENAFKWEELEPQEGKPNHSDIDNYLKWSQKHNFPLRGHTLVWGIENFGFDRHWARVKDDAFLKNAIQSRINRDLTKYKGKIIEYDVWNEPIHEPSLTLRLGPDILDSAFIWAHRADPDARLFINEYSIISGGDAKLYRDLIDDLLKKGVPLHGIGVQGHFSSRIEPLEVASKLYYMAETGLPIKITEFDLDVNGMNLSEQEMAIEYSKMMRTAFSHPAVEGFLFWGFWDGRHWRPGAGIYDYDFKAKAAADSVYNLIHQVWTTKETVKADSAGLFKFRGYYGTYSIKTSNGKKKQFTIDLTSKSNQPVVVDINSKK